MHPKKKRRAPLTLRLLKAMRTTLSQAEAGGPEDLEGYQGDAAEKKYQDIRDAWSWVQDEIAAREKRSKKR